MLSYCASDITGEEVGQKLKTFIQACMRKDPENQLKSILIN